MPICLNCHHEFGLPEAPGAAGVTADGTFMGRCPKCESISGLRENFPTARYSDLQVENIVCGLEIAGDNLCQRVADLLWQRNWRAGFNGVMQ